MNINLKRDQLPVKQAQNWRENYEEEAKFTFNLEAPRVILQKETYKILAGENENRVRIYLGIEPPTEEGKFVLCTYAVSAFLLGSGDVYADYETPVFKLGRENINVSEETSEVIENIERYIKWRNGELDPDSVHAQYRKFIYPKAYLLTKYELHEIFNVQNRKEAEIGFGISKLMNIMIYPHVKEDRTTDDGSEVFDFAGTCPPVCGEKSMYNL